MATADVLQLLKRWQKHVATNREDLRVELSQEAHDHLVGIGLLADLRASTIAPFFMDSIIQPARRIHAEDDSRAFLAKVAAGAIQVVPATG